MQAYHYPDFQDVMIGKFLTAFEKNDGYWERSEREILEFVITYFQNKPGYVPNSFLDAGCGQGRLIDTFAPHFKRIVAIDPDPWRVEKASNVVKDLGLHHKVALFHASAEEFKTEERFDLILVSHVIQHVPSHVVVPLLMNLRDLLSEHGIMVVNTCHSVHDANHFLKDFLEDDIPVRCAIDEEEFNQLIDVPGILPIQFFNKEVLMNEISAIGLRLAGFRVFHISKEERDVFQVPDIDNYINSSPDLQAKHGIDMCLILEKT